MIAPSIDVQNISYAYPDGTHALRDVTLRVASGGATALIGANGAGKSTLLLHLNGCLTAQRGVVRIGDDAVTRETAPRLRRQVGLVFQDPDDQLFMPTVAEDVAFGPLNAGLAADAVERRVAEALDRVGLPHLRDRPPYRLSAGEKRAVAIATVLAMDPGVLVLDEPSTHLDPRARRRLIGLLTSLAHTRMIATHDLELVLAVCREVVVLDAGRVVAAGPTAAILADEPLMLAHGLETPHSLSAHASRSITTAHGVSVDRHRRLGVRGP